VALQKGLTFWCWKRARQAGSSSRIENYLGFPKGISGQELAARAYLQAQKFGAEILISKGIQLVCNHKPYVVEVENGARIPARTVVIATGAAYRRPQLKNLPRFEGAGVYYAATFVEAQLCAGEEVIVVGGGNAVGQAVVFLAETTKRVHILVRSASLVENMSRYLIRRIEETPAIAFRPHTEIVALEGGDQPESVRWRNSQVGQTAEHKIRHVFLMTGGPLLRPPYLLEASLPGVFAVGDVLGGSIKRVASAVGEGSIAISFVHKVLQE
jgi:thioredoxin reductase (NADPH)